MAKHNRNQLESDILLLLAENKVLALQEITSALKEQGFDYPYQTIRRVVVDMVNKGKLYEMPRGQNNVLEVTLNPHADAVMFFWLDGKSISVREFINNLVEKDSSGIFKDEVWDKVRGLIFTALATSYPNPYGKSLPPVGSVRDALISFLETLSVSHAFIKRFLESGAFDPKERETLNQLFQSALSEEHQLILNEEWKVSADGESQHFEATED